MNLTKFSIERNRVVLSLLVLVMVMGAIMYQSLSRDSMPPYTVRVATIVSSFPGASPERVEALVTDKIEKVTQELPELKEVKSTSRAGLSVVNVELKMDVKPEELQSVWDRLRRKLSTITDLPENVKPNLKDDGIGEVYGIVVGLTSDGYSFKEMKKVADNLRNDLIKLQEAAKVELNGIQEERIFVEFNEAKLKKYGLTSGYLKSLISSTNILNSGGEISIEDQRIILEPTGNFNKLESIEKLLVATGDGNVVIPLKDITNIRKGYITPSSQIVRVNGKEAVSLHIALKKGENIIELGQKVDEVLIKWQEKLPIGLELIRVSSIDNYIDVKIDGFVSNLLQSIGIVLAVMLVFLGLRTGFIIASLIPIVTISSLMVMGLIDMGLNQITLAALIMALGMMVDNGIVVAEAIMVKTSKGLPVKEAAIDSCRELLIPLLISTLTTSSAFLSFYLAESVMGDIMGPLFVVITIALIASWLISLSLITLFCVMFIKIKPKNSKPAFLDKIFDFLKLKYKDLILVGLSFKKSILVGIILLLFLSLYGFTHLSFVFFPDSDRNMITVDVNLPQGTRIDITNRTVSQIEKFMLDSLKVTENRSEGIVSWSSYIGKGPSSYDLGYNADEANSNYAHILVNTTSFEVNTDMVNKLDSYCFKTYPSADIKVGLLGSGGGGTPIEIKVSGDDPDKLAEISDRLKQRLSEIKGTKNIKDDWGPRGLKFVVDIDPDKTISAGITNQDIAISLQTVFDGFSVGEFREENNTIPILLKSDNRSEQTISSLETLLVFAQQSRQSVPLSQIAKIVPLWEYAKIKRLNLNRTIVVSSELTSDGNASEITNTLKPWLESQSKDWGGDYSFSLGGDAQNTAENMGAVAKYLPLSFFIIILLLIMQFNSLRKTLMVVSTIPLGIIGMVLGLMCFGVPFGFMAFLGVISLAGIVINNAIVLVDRIEVEINELNRSPQDAILSACLQRFRPILLATFTTVLGLIPLYISGGAIWQPMAVTIMVGLLFGTVITLVFIPAFYSLLFKVNYKNYSFDVKLMEE